MADVGLVGTFAGYGPTRWNTADGHRPTQAEIQQTSARLERPFTLTDVEPLFGRAPADRLIEGGGTAGCDLVDYDSNPDLLAGTRYVMLLYAVDDSVGNPSGNVSLTDAWDVTPDGTIHTPGEGDISIAELRRRLSASPTPVPPPNNEPTSGPPG